MSDTLTTNTFLPSITLEHGQHLRIKNGTYEVIDALKQEVIKTGKIVQLTHPTIADKRDAIELELKEHDAAREIIRLRLLNLQEHCPHPHFRRGESQCLDCGFVFTRWSK